MTSPPRPSPDRVDRPPARSRRVVAAALAVALAGTVACSGADDGGPAPTTDATESEVVEPEVVEPAAERTELAVVPIPRSVRGARYAAWTADGGAILLSGTPEG